PSSRTLPLPTARTTASTGFSFAVSGMMRPPLVFSSAFTRRTMTRSWSGRIFTFNLLLRRAAKQRSAFPRHSGVGDRAFFVPGGHGGFAGHIGVTTRHFRHIVAFLRDGA